MKQMEPLIITAPHNPHLVRIAQTFPNVNYSNVFLFCLNDCIVNIIKPTL